MYHKKYQEKRDLLQGATDLIQDGENSLKSDSKSNKCYRTLHPQHLPGHRHPFLSQSRKK